MLKKQIYIAAVAAFLFLLASCGGSGVTLGPFPAISKTEGDAPFALVAPSSSSPAAFAFSSSDTNVATISGNMVTVKLAGTTTITAQQPRMGSYYETSTSTLLTVAPRVCTLPTVRENGQCVNPCVLPAVRQNGECVAPAPGTANYVTRGQLAWMPTTFALTWSDANAFCTSSKINGLTGWQLATEFDLTELFASGALAGQGWTLGKTWSSTSGAATGTHLAVQLSTGASAPELNDNKAYVACVR
ncbi:MAG: hypothetical protein ACJ8LG_10070 [Massilia sp.]